MIRAKTRVISLATLMALATGLVFFPVNGQSIQAPTKLDDLVQEKQRLLSELQGLAARARQLEKPLARGSAEAEIADAAWSIDRNLAKELLRDAYSLALPEEAEQAKLRKRSVGAQPQMPTFLDNARSAVRQLVLRIASRDKAFANNLVASAMEKLGWYDAHQGYASLAHSAIEANDYEAASKYTLQSIDAEPTQITGPLEINDLASKNRAAADEVLVAYMNRLNSVALSTGNGSRMRVSFALTVLMHPEMEFFTRISGIPPPGPAVMHAYVVYVLNNLALLEEQSPNDFVASHLYLLHLYPVLQQYAPELKQQFLDLEQRSRKPGENFSLPTAKSLEEEYKAKSAKQAERELESDRPDETVIQRVIGRGDFSRARKMIDKLEEGPQKAQLTEILNTQRAIGLANSDDLPGALKLAESLIRADDISRVFSAIAGKCVAKNDYECARGSINQATGQLKEADLTPFVALSGMPAPSMGTSKDFDPVLTGLARLALVVIPEKDDLALDVLDELVIAANHSDLDTGQGRTGFETSLFKKLAEKDEQRTTAAAIRLQDPLRQIVAMAAIDQWKAEQLTKAETASKKNDPPVKK